MVFYKEFESTGSGYKEASCGESAAVPLMPIDLEDVYNLLKRVLRKVEYLEKQVGVSS